MRASILAVVALIGCKGPVERDVTPPPPDAPRVVVVEPPKLVAYRRFLAGPDATLHSLRLGAHRTWQTYLSWMWPGWMSRAKLDAALDGLLALAAKPPATAADEPVRAYVQAVRELVPVWERAVAAWANGADAYAAIQPELAPSFERFGAVSARWRHAMPREPDAPAGSFEAAARACLVGAEILARIDQAAPVDEITAEATPSAPPTIYVPEPAGNLRSAGLRCARLALDEIEEADAAQQADAQQLMSLGLLLVNEEDRRAQVYGAYVTVLGNYAQLAYYATD